MFLRNRFPIVMLWTIIAALVLSNNAMAYIGPGSGMEYFAYAIGLMIMMGAAFLSFLMWPLYAVLRWLRGTKPATVSDQAAAGTADAPPGPMPLPPSDNGHAAPPSL